MWKYLRYFFYLAYNWNIPIAWHIIKHEKKGEKKYGISTTGTDSLKSLENKGIDISHATMYMAASYDLLEEIFAQNTIKSSKHLLDMGSGKGRILCVAASNGISQVTGVEISKDFSQQARINLDKIREKGHQFDGEIIVNDAFYYEIPLTVDCIIFFNPFDEVIMSGVIRNIDKSLKQKPRKLNVIYLNPLHKQLFINEDYAEIFHTQKMKYLEAIILTKNPG